MELNSLIDGLRREKKELVYIFEAKKKEYED